MEEVFGAEDDAMADQNAYIAPFIFVLTVARSGKLLHFKDSTFHRVIPGFMVRMNLGLDIGW